MAGVSQVLVVARGAREAEGIVAPAGILDEFQQRLVIDGVILGVQAGARVERAHQGAGGGGVDLAFEAPVEGAQAERLEVGALAPLHVHDLDELARLDFVCPDGPGWMSRSITGSASGGGGPLAGFRFVLDSRRT